MVRFRPGERRSRLALRSEQPKTGLLTRQDRHFGMLISLDDLRRFAAANSLFPPITLKHALHKLGFDAQLIDSPREFADDPIRGGHKATVVLAAGSGSV